MSQTNGDDDLAVRPRERDEADARLAEALRDALDRAPVVARVEERRGLDDRLLVARRGGAGPARRDRLDGGRRRRRRRSRRARAGGGGALAASRASIGLALPDPAVLERHVLAERADVDEVVAPSGANRSGSLAHQEGAARRSRTGVGRCTGFPTARPRQRIWERRGRLPATLQCDAFSASRGLPASRRSASARCATAPPRSAGSACGSRRGRRSARSATASTSGSRPSAPRP